MGVLDYIKAAYEIAQTARNVDLQAQLMDIKSEVLNLQDENMCQHQRIAELERERDTRQTVTYRQPSYYATKLDGTEDGPFCQRCYDVDHRLVRTHDTKTMTGLQRECAECETKLWVERWNAPDTYRGGGSWMSG